ncbi:hypothetical protein NMG60_11017823 [Bertholletia excelsa]
MDGQILLGRQLTVVFAEENRKKPGEMRARERGGRGRYDRRRSPARYSRSPHYARSQSHSRDYYSPSKRRQGSRSISPQDRRHTRERSYSPSPAAYNNGSRSRSQSPVRECSLPYNGSRSHSRSPPRKRSPTSRGRSRSLSQSRSRSPNPVDYSREPERDESPSR